MNTSQVWRFPKKYAELFRNLSDEEVGRIIKSLFLWGGNLEWLSKAYFDIIKVDLDNLEKTAMNWLKWGRPKKEETSGYEKEKPQVIENDNLKEKINEKERVNERIKEKEQVNTITEESLATVPLANDVFRSELISGIRKKDTSQHGVTEWAILFFEDFGHKYNKDETYYSLREWFINISKLHHKSNDDIYALLFNWHTYWKGQPKNKQPKDCKASFSKNPFLNSKFDKNENK
jgi:hypothetical protein